MKRTSSGQHSAAAQSRPNAQRTRERESYLDLLLMLLAIALMFGPAICGCGSAIAPVDRNPNVTAPPDSAPAATHGGHGAFGSNAFAPMRNDRINDPCLNATCNEISLDGYTDVELVGAGMTIRERLGENGLDARRQAVLVRRMAQIDDVMIQRSKRRHR